MKAEQFNYDWRRLQAEQAVILNQVDNAVALFDSAHRLVLFNQKLAQMWGLALHQLENLPHCDELLATVVNQGYWSAEQCRELKQALEQAKTTPVSYKFIQTDDSCVEVDVTATPEGGCSWIFRQPRPQPVLTVGQPTPCSTCLSPESPNFQQPTGTGQPQTCSISDIDWCNLLLGLTEQLHSGNLEEVAHTALSYVMQTLDAACADIKIIRGVGTDRWAAPLTHLVSSRFRDIYSESVIADWESLKQEISYGQELLWQVVETGKPLFIEDYAAQSQAIERFRHLGINGLALFPLLASDGTVIAVLTLETHHLQQLQTSPLYKGILATCRTLATLIEQVQLQERLRLLESIAINAREAVLITEAAPINLPGPRIVYVNQAFTRVTGYTPEEAIGQTPRILQGPNTDRLKLGKIRSAINRGEPVSVELINQRKDGSKYWLEINITPILDEEGEVTHFVSVMQETTERKQSEAALRKAHTQLEQRAAQLAVANQELHNMLEKLKIAEEELRQQNEELVIARQSAEQERQRYQDLFDFAPDGYLVTDATGKILEANRATATLFCAEQERLVGIPLSVFIPSQERETFHSQLNQLNDFRLNPRSFELNLLPREGESFPAAIRVTPIQNSQEELVGFRWLIRDVTERKQAEEALRQSEQRFRAIFERAAFGIGLTDWAGRSIQSNPTLQAILGYSPEELSQMAFTEYTHPEDIEIDAHLYQELSAGKLNHYQVEKRYIRKDGQLVWGRLTVCLVRDRQEQPQFAFSMLEDITERKRAESALQESEHKFRAIFEKAAIGITLKNLEGRNLECNSALQEILGYSHQELCGITCTEYTYPEDIATDLDLYRKLVAGKLDYYQIEKRYIRKDGDLVWGHLTVCLVRDEQEKPQFTFGMVKDITESKRAEEALKESEDRYRRLVELSPDTIFVQSQGNMVFVNSAGVKLLGASSPEQLVGKPVLEFIHPDSHNVVQERMQQLKAGKIVPLKEEKFIRIDGTIVDVEVSASPFTYRGQPAAQVVIRDISERKQMEALQSQLMMSLQLSEQRFRIAAQCATDLIYEWDFDNRCIEWFGKIDEQLGYDLGEFPRTLKAWEKALHPDDRERVKAAVERHLQAQEPFVEEYRVRRKDGSYLYWMDRGTALWDATGKPYKWIGVNTNVTERKLYEARMKRLVDSNIIGIVVADISGNVIETNDAFLRIVGYTREDVLENRVPWSEITPSEYAGVDATATKEVRETGICPSFEKQYIRKDGSRVPVLVGLALFEGYQEECVAFVLDLTERKQLEEFLRQTNSQLGIQVEERTTELRDAIEQLQNEIVKRQRMQEALIESEERYRSVVAALQEGIMLHNLDGTIQACNPSAERILGLSAAQLLGRSSIDFRWRTIHEDGSPFPGDTHPAMITLQTGKPCSNVVMGVYKLDGKLTWISVNSQPLFHPQETQPYAVVVSFSDISARKQAEEVIRTTQAKLQHLLTSSPAVIYSCKPSGNFDFLYISENIAAQLGYEPRQFLEDSKFWCDCIHPEDLPNLLADWPNLLEEGYRIHEYRFRHQDGTYHWLHDELRVLKDETGNPIEVVGSWFDVTGFKWAEKALRDTLQRLTFHVENSPLAVIEWDRDMRVTRWSREAENIFGWKISEVVGRHPDTWQFVVEEDVEHVNQVMNQLFSGSDQRSVSYNRNYRVDGSIVHCEWYNSVLFDESGNFVSLLSLVHNITERKLAEEALAKRERYLATLVDIQRQLLILESDEDLYSKALEPLGHSASASRVYVFENHRDGTSRLLMSQRAEWCADGIPSKINNPLLQNLSYDQLPRHWVKLLMRGEIITGGATELPEIKRLGLMSPGILSFLILPLMVNGEFFGFIGFDNCQEERTWEPFEVDLLRAAVAAISLAQESQQTESALKASERRYRELVETSQDMIWSVNAQGHYSFVNQAVKQIHGYEPEEMIGRPFTDFMSPQQAVLDLQMFERLLAGEPCFQYETMHLRKDGRPIQLSFNAIVLHDEQGNVLGTTGTARDITERKRAEEELQRQSLRSLLLADITLKIRQSLQLEEILQNTVKEVRKLLRADRVLIYRIWSDKTGSVLTEAVIPDWFTLVGQSFSEETFPTECHSLYCQGTIRTIEDIETAELAPCHTQFLEHLQVKAELVVPIVQQKTLWGLMIAHQRQPHQWSSFEIELLQQLANQLSIALAQSQLIEALRESEQRFRTMADSAPVFLWMSDPDKYCTFFNQSWLTFRGRTLNQEIGNGWIEGIHPADLSHYLETYTRAFDARQNFILEYRLKRADGEYRWVLDTGTPRFMSDGNFAGYIGSCIDITDRKQAEEEICRALEKEKELSDLKSRFVSMTSHEFRTPLSVILSSAELLEHYGHRWSEAERHEQLHRIQSAVSNMTQLLNDVLLIGKAEAGQIPFNPAYLDVISFCQEVVEELQFSAGNRYVLQFSHDVASLNAYLDKKLLRQILSNLLSNAIKYSPQGGEIQLQLSFENDQVIFHLQDQGIGIPPEDQPRLFESFHRATNVGTIPGTGLGLAIVKKCVDLHGGEVTVSSQVGVGTTFTIALPFDRQPGNSKGA